VTSVDRDDLKDGGAQHFVECIRAVRKQAPRTTIEILVPDFRGRLERALEVLSAAPPDVMNHNLRNSAAAVPPGAPGRQLRALACVAAAVQAAPSAGADEIGIDGRALGETDDEILQVMRDLRAHDVEMVTIGQYLAPSAHHLPVERYVHPDAFAVFEREAQCARVFATRRSGRSFALRITADRQAHAAGVE
jgi:lipoic acid synthetase